MCAGVWSRREGLRAVTHTRNKHIKRLLYDGACVSVYVCMHAHMHVCMYVCMHACVSVCVCVCHRLTGVAGGAFFEKKRIDVGRSRTQITTLGSSGNLDGDLSGCVGRRGLGLLG